MSFVDVLPGDPEITGDTVYLQDFMPDEQSKEGTLSDWAKNHPEAYTAARRQLFNQAACLFIKAYAVQTVKSSELAAQSTTPPSLHRSLVFKPAIV